MQGGPFLLQEKADAENKIKALEEVSTGENSVQ